MSGKEETLKCREIIEMFTEPLKETHHSKVLESNFIKRRKISDVPKTPPVQETKLSAKTPCKSRGPFSIWDEFEVSRYDSDFTDMEVIGSGDFGTVYRAKHRLDQMFYAVKEIRIEPKPQVSINRALQEALALAASSSWDDNVYIIRYHNVWLEQNSLFLSMELCDCSLSKYIERSRDVSEQLLKKIMRDVCKGLEKLHRSNIVHLDIKAENILFSFTHKFKLADLGLARITTNLVGEIPEGDSRYLAPELLEFVDHKVLDLTKADIFSLGATILEILSEKPLPSRGTEWHKLREGSFSVPSHFSHGLKTALTRMLAKDPSQRPSASELLNTYLLSESKQLLRGYRHYTHLLHQQLRAKPYKKRKLSV